MGGHAHSHGSKAAETNGRFGRHCCGEFLSWYAFRWKE
jgi:hypothetical protein